MHGQRDLLDWQEMKSKLKRGNVKEKARRRGESTVLGRCFGGEWREWNRWREGEYLFKKLGIPDSNSVGPED